MSSTSPSDIFFFFILVFESNLFRFAIRFAQGGEEETFAATSLPTLVQMIGSGLGVSFLPKMAVQAGVVISASHNPYPDNGIKFFAGTGFKLPDAVEDELEELVARGMETLPRPTGKAVGSIIAQPERIREYEDFLRTRTGGKILFLELGVGYNTPVIIKYPFWQMTAKNPNATYICINQGQAVCPPEIEQRSICMNADVGQVLQSLSDAAIQ